MIPTWERRELRQVRHSGGKDKDSVLKVAGEYPRNSSGFLIRMQRATSPS